MRNSSVDILNINNELLTGESLAKIFNNYFVDLVPSDYATGMHPTVCLHMAATVMESMLLFFSTRPVQRCLQHCSL